VYHGDGFTYRATKVRRSPRLSCRKARNLLRAAYRQGPLKIVRTVYQRDSRGRKVGRPVYWIRGGWRCSNGAGGAACRHARKRRFNSVRVRYVPRRFAVIANVGYRTGS
jgi:hypothetical protein